MVTCRAGKEIIVRVRNDIGVLAQLTKVVAEKGLNIAAVSGWVEGIDAVIRLVTEDNLRAVETLRAHNFNPREADVVLCESPHRPGILRHITAKLADAGIDIHHIYATAAAGGANCLVVLRTANNDRALVELNT